MYNYFISSVIYRVASQDFYYDLADKLSKDGWEYMIISMKKGKKAAKISTLYRLTTKKTSRIMADALEEISQNIKQQL